jgi:hypothetical protein
MGLKNENVLARFLWESETVGLAELSVVAASFFHNQSDASIHGEHSLSAVPYAEAPS